MENNNISLIFIIAVTFLTTKAQGLFNPSETLISDDISSLLSSRKQVCLFRYSKSSNSADSNSAISL